MRRPLILAILFAAGVTTPLMAQRSVDRLERWEHPGFRGPDETKVGSSSIGEQPGRRDYRYEGLLIGGVPFGTLGAILGHGLTPACPTVPGADCSPDRLGNAITLGLVGAALGGGLGYLIGWLSPKPAPPNAADSTAF